MSIFLPARWLAILLAFAALPAVAQTAPHPFDARSAEAAPALSFRSALEGYRSYADEKAIPWKEANETVYSRGGWRAYAKEASEEGAEGSAPSKGEADPHADHSTPVQKKAQP